MPLLKFNQIPYYNTDQAANAIDPDDIFNCYLELAPGIGTITKRRPGLSEFADLNTGVQGDGIFFWEAKNLVIAVSNGLIYSLNENGTFQSITTDPLIAGTTVKFADGSKLDSTPVLYMANGNLVHSDNGSNTSIPADPSAPILATQVAYLNLKFIANNPETNQFLFTDVNPDSGFQEFDYWSSADNPLTAESRGDDLAVIEQYLQELNIWGTQSLEIWVDDGVTPLISIPQGASEAGIEAPYSVKQVSDKIFALVVIDGIRHVVRMDGRTPTIISEPIAQVIASYGTVSDAIGQSITVNGISIYLLQFPSAGKTWAYDLKSDSWVPWGTWNEKDGIMEQFIGQHSCFVKTWNKHLIMSRVDGRIFELDFGTNTDGDAPTKSYRRTIWEEHGRASRKRSDRLKLKVKTGSTINGALYLRWADDGSEEWSNYMEIELGPIGKRDFIIDLPQMGMYESRRYEISITDDAELVFLWANEYVTYLRV
jgi:hypothetical protein